MNEQTSLKIVNSKTYNKEFSPTNGSLASITTHYFDSFQVKQAHNGQDSFAIIFNGQTVGRIDSSAFYKAMKERQKIQEAKFLAS